MRTSLPLFLLAAVTLAACGVTPQSRCQRAASDCLDDWTSTDVANCTTEWEIRVEEAREADCSQTFQTYFQCLEDYSQCFTEDRDDGTYTVWGLRADDTVCDDEYEAHFVDCM
jgi:hypothetical protein